MWLWLETYTLRMADETVTLTIKERDGYYALVTVGPEGSTVEHFFTPRDAEAAAILAARILKTVGFELDKPIRPVPTIPRPGEA